MCAKLYFETKNAATASLMERRTFFPNP